MRSLIIGGTQGLGLALARASLAQGIEPIVTGQTVSSEPFLIDGTPVRREAVQVADEASVEALMHGFETTPSLGFGYLFYLPAKHLKGAFADQPSATVDELFDVTVKGLLNVVRHFHRMKKRPYHLIVVASTTSWRVRGDEAVYGMAKAAQAQFARNFHGELARDLPGSRTLIVHPGGMRTHFLDQSGIDSASFTDPQVIADLIWQELRDQESDPASSVRELHLLRQEGGTVKIERGAKAPQ